ncbi:hypothetical protein [Thermomonospora amylolytica]|uniref:hypothetical protein n=1 Tax=Thermomonospora amylolytica TaxID=1411117 RepID=UPI000E6B91D8|nr:hypothetical protein [Thermomonospora amylolytica]
MLRARPLTLSLAALTAAGLTLGTLPAAAYADDPGTVTANETPLTTKFTEFEVTPTELEAADGLVSFRGRLVYVDAEGVEHPLAGATLTVMEWLPPYPTVVTDADGRFSGSVYMPEGGWLAVHYLRQGDIPYRPAFSPSIRVNVTGTVPTRLSLQVSPTGKVFTHDVLTATGRLEWQRNTGEWLPLRSSRVYVRCTDNSSTEFTTGPDGTYGGPFPIKYRCNSPFLYATFSSPTYDSPLDYASARPPVTPDVHVRTRYVEVPWPATVTRGGSMSLTGRIWGDEGRGYSRVYDTSMVLEYSPDGQTWKQVAEDRLNEFSEFTLTAPAPGPGRWRVRPGEMPYYYVSPGVAQSPHVPMRERTRFTEVNASPEPVRKGGTITFKARLQRTTATGWTALPWKKVTVQFRANGTTTWRNMATATTGKLGYVTKTFTAAKDGTWRVVYGGETAYLAVTGSGDYVDVR